MPIEPRHLTILDELVVDAHAIADGSAKPTPSYVSTAGDDRGIDADHFAGRIHQRSSAVAGIDRGIGLQEMLEGPADVAALGADDARGDGRSNPNGLPKANTQSPTDIPSELPILAAINACFVQS